MKYYEYMIHELSLFVFKEALAGRGHRNDQDNQEVPS